MRIAIIGIENRKLKTHQEIYYDHKILSNLAKAFVSLGHSVWVFSDGICKDILHYSIPTKYNGRWALLPYYKTMDNEYELCIMWRRNSKFDLNLGRLKCARVYTIAYKFQYHNNNNYVLPDFNGIFFLSEFQRYISMKYLTLGNNTQERIIYGSFNSELSDRNRNKYTIGYYSEYDKGLEVLLSIWPRVRSTFPEAGLYILQHHSYPRYYGLELYEGLDEDGITISDTIDETQISIWAYPSIVYEAFCHDAIRAHRSGNIPVINRVGCLDELCHEDSPSVLCSEQEIKEQYLSKLLETLENIDAFDRSKYVQFAEKFTWRNSVETILELYRKQ